MQGLGFSANVLPSELEKIRQATTWGIKMLESNFYSGLVTEAAVVRGVQFSAQNAGCGSSGQPGAAGASLPAARSLPLAAGGAKVWKDVMGSVPAGAPTAAAFRTRGGAVGPPGGRGAFPSPAQCGILGLREPGRPTLRGPRAELPHPSTPPLSEFRKWVNSGG